MLEMLKARKEELQAQGKKGFTLMEMLIVIAIIAVLVAIAIPVFTSQLDNAKVAADEANARSMYAVLAADYADDGAITGAPAASGSMIPNNRSGEFTVTVKDQQFTFSDKTTKLDYTIPGTGTGPKIELTTNGTDKVYGG